MNLYILNILNTYDLSEEKKEKRKYDNLIIIIISKSSGVAVAEECKTHFEEVKKGKKHRSVGQREIVMFLEVQLPNDSVCPSGGRWDGQKNSIKKTIRAVEVLGSFRTL